MRYFGGKARIASPLSKYINEQLKEGQPFVDLFCGSCNVISKIDNMRTRVANDAHFELIALHSAVQSGEQLPDTISEDEYYEVKTNGQPWLKGFVGFGLSYSGKWWGGYARGGEDRNYCKNAKNTLLKKHANLKDVEFIHGSYIDCAIPESALLYCDIPYKDTTQYSVGQFDHKEFYAWAENMVSKGHTVLVSEYAQNLPEGWRIVWKHQSKKDIRNKDGVQEATIEILMTPNKEYK